MGANRRRGETERVGDFLVVLAVGILRCDLCFSVRQPIGHVFAPPSSRAFSSAMTLCAAKICANRSASSEKGRTDCR